MNKIIRKCVVCAVLTAVVATGWGAGAHSGIAEGKASAVQSAQKAALPSAAQKDVSAPATQKTTVVVPVQKPTPAPVASKASASQQVEKALKADGMAGVKCSADGTRLVSCNTNAVAVKIGKTVKLIHGNAFRGCAELLRVQFLGDAPNAADEVFADLPCGCTIYIEKGSKGWPNGIPCVWKGMRVRYSDEIKDMPMTLDGRITLVGTGYRVRPCGDGVALYSGSRCSSASAAGTFVVPEKIGNAPVRILGDSVFPDCTNVAKVVIPASVTNFGLSAFSRCGKPRQIEIGAGNPEYRVEGGVLYELSTKTVIMACADVSSVKVPANALRIGPDAFKGCCKSLTTVELPATLKAIGRGAFAGCVGLSIVMVPDDADVAPDAFEGCCATVKKVGTYRHYDGFAGKSSEVRWIPENMKVEGPFSVPLPLREAVERAGKGDGFALYSLAIHCAKGGDAKRDPIRAMEYLREAVSEKDVCAEFLLGLVLESRMAGSDLNDPAALGIAGHLGRFVETSTSPNAVTPFEKYVGVPSSAFADSKKAATVSAGSLANEKDYELLRGVYEAACQHGCSAAGVRLEHLSYLSLLECRRAEKDANQRLLDELRQKR